jgi:PAS domain S-box-containing protein
MEERKNTHQKKDSIDTNLTENLSEFQEFIDLIPEIVYELDLDGKLVLVNKAGLDILGYTREEFEKGIYVKNIIISEELDYMKSNIKKIVDSKKSFKFEYHARKKDGTAFPVLVNSSPFFKNNKIAGTRGIVFDLTERKLAERKLKDANDFLNTTINAMQEPFFVKDENHKWVILNDASIKMWGHSREDLIGKSDYDIFPKEQADVFWEKDDFVFKNGSNTNIEEITDSNGEVRTIVTAKVLYTDEITEKKFIVGTIHDITDLRNAELKLKEYSIELEDSNKNKDKFFSIIAHDLRNPFTSIYGFSSVLSEEFDTLTKEEIREYINYIYTGTKNIYDLIENLLAWSRIQTGRALVQPVKLDMFSEVQDAINIFNVFSKNKRIKLINAVEKNVYALGDDNMVDSILQNLISNALKFTKTSGFVKITSKVLDKFVEISISDNGIGMSRDEIDNLFQLGKQKSKTGTSEEKGTGLGLILCKEMVTRLNGQMKVESVVNKGSTFSFTLPKIQ